MDDQTSRFLEAFTDIEQRLRNQSSSSQWLDFPELVDDISRNNSSVQRHRDTLKVLNRFRNLIVHHYSRNKSMAVPTGYAVERITAIRDELLSPPTLLTLAASPVEQCSPTDPLGRSVKKMHDGSFSQLPIYDGQTCLGLLTAETIARWLASHLADGVGLIEEEPISDVMQHQENHENYAFMGRAATVADGLVEFDNFLHRGKNLDAILITHSGRSSEKLLGIVTINDIPKLRRAIQD